MKRHRGGVMTPRRATAADAAAMRAIAAAAYEKYIPRMGRRPRPMDADFEAAAAGPETWVLDVGGGSLAAYAILEVHEDHVLVENLAVSPEHQSGGLGRRLLTHAADRARALGLGEVRLYTHLTMVENVALYTRFGYRETHRDDERVFMTQPL